MNVVHWNESNDGLFSEAALRKKIEDLGYSVSRYTYPPGTSFPNHTHAVDKIDAVVSGVFRMETSAGAFTLEAGDYLAVPQGTVHNASVVGAQAVVSLDAIRL